MSRTHSLTLHIPVLAALSLGSTSCWSPFHKTKAARVFVPPPARPRPPLPTKPAELPPAPEIDAPSFEIPPDMEVPAGALAKLPPAGDPPVTQPKPQPPKRAATPEPPPRLEPPPPKLSQIFTADQLRENNRIIDESSETVKRVLARAAGKTLNAEQSEILNRIQIFQKQAEQARESDLVTAVNLARRADLLAQDLLKRLP